IERHLESTLLAVHLYGSAVDGGLKPYSDIDLLVTVTVRLDETTRRALINDLLETSASPGESEILRAVEVTIVVHDDIIPWRYPAKRELQFGEWQRNDILAGIFEPAMIDIDLAILLTKAREHSVALVGPAAEEFFDPVPEQDLFEALRETLKLWNSQPDWAGDERNVVLTLSRIWYSAITGKIAPCLTIRSSRPRYARRLNSGVVLTKKNKNLRIPFLIICGFNKRIFLCFN
ncbi:AadA family aminoglycoside 3''-O-nucleotidyltransferase, partial [Escherichia coli]|uniref:AadA family aminoglycoside 3''-O-nucleotidyltransferase n=1 Tax=Escherichia coli TaxID=562 RepID=UPI003CC91093